MTESYQHRKILFKPKDQQVELFADYYQRSHRRSPAAMVVYIGGAIPETEYERRRTTTPDALASIFKDARKDKEGGIDFLVCSPPASITLTGEKMLQSFLQWLLYGFLPLTDNPRPTSLAFIGNSFGAYLATYCALSLAPTKALFTCAGVGMVEAADMSNCFSKNTLEVKVCCNLDDGGMQHSRDFIDYLSNIEVPSGFNQQPGGHSLIDYIENGSALDGFSFICDML